MQLIFDEDVLIDWTQPIYLNFTHAAIVGKLEEFYNTIGGRMEKLYGDFYVMTDPLENMSVDTIET